MLVLKGDDKKVEMNKEKAKKASPVIDANVKATKELASAIKDLAAANAQSPQAIQQPEANTDLMEALIRLNETQQALIEKLGYKSEDKVKNWEFSVTRDRSGAIKKITAVGE